MKDFLVFSFKNEQLPLLKTFTQNLGSSGESFRYFESRNLKNALKNHVKTLIVIDDKKIVGYGHLDKDPGDLKTWLGICLLEEYCGHGLGKKIMEELLRGPKEDIYLSVDSDNIAGQKLYSKFGFKVTSSKASIVYMKKSYV